MAATNKKLNVKKGDSVQVITGKDKGAKGRVIQAHPETERVLVEGINRVKRHTRPNPQAGNQGGIVEKEMPLPASKIAIFNAASKKDDRIGFKTLADGKKVRFFKSNGEMLDA